MLTFVMLRCGAFVAFLTVVATAVEKPGVLDKIKSGLEYASSYIETAKEIADLVSESLGHRNRKRDENGEGLGGNFGEKKSIFGTNGLTAAFFRLLGLDASKINAIVVNSAIYLAQMISTAFNLKSQIERSRSMEVNSEDPEPGEEQKWAQGPMQLILGSGEERIQRLVRKARDANLPTHLVDRIDGLDTACIRLLVCKASPVIWAAQRSLSNDTRRAKWDMTSWLPSKTEFEENGDKCEENHKACQLFPEF